MRATLEKEEKYYYTKREKYCKKKVQNYDEKIFF